MIKQYRKVIEHEIEVDENIIFQECKKIIKDYNKYIAHLPCRGGGLTGYDIFEEVILNIENTPHLIKIDGENYLFSDIEVFFSYDLYEEVENIIENLILERYGGV